MSFFNFIVGLIAGAGSYYLYARYSSKKVVETTREPLWFQEPSTANGEFVKFIEAEPYKVAVKFRD